MENSCNSLCSDPTGYYTRCSVILLDIPRNATSNKYEQRHRRATRVSRAHNNPANYFGNTNAASIFSAIIRTSARTVPQKRQALRFLLAVAVGACIHTQAHVAVRVGVHAVAADRGTELESVGIPSRTSQTCCLRRPVCLATPITV